MKGKKTGGRQKGTPNKTSTITKEIINEIADGLTPNLAKDLASLEPKDRINVWLKLIEFVVPKPKMDIGLESKTPVTIENILLNLAKENEA